MFLTRYLLQKSAALLAVILFWIAYPPWQASSMAGYSSRAVVHAVLFYSPTCGHCQKVMTEDLPPLKEKYGDQLDILELDATQEPGKTLYFAALDEYQVPRERWGVPALFVGNTHLVGSVEIPELFPGMIEEGMNQGGIPFPNIPGLSEFIPEEPVVGRPQADGPLFWQKFMLDPLANGIAVAVLVGMVVSVLFVGMMFLKAPGGAGPSRLPGWLVPVLCLVGLGIAGYLSIVEVTDTAAVCGPVGDCNSVQQSPYASVMGIPVGILGLAGYLAILVAWLLQRVVSPSTGAYISLAIWGMAFLGTLFAIYLTFLEPFVIGATCAWCVTNSIVITLLLWATSRPALQSAGQLGGGED